MERFGYRMDAIQRRAKAQCEKGQEQMTWPFTVAR
jgi:hypothetical protein